MRYQRSIAIVLCVLIAATIYEFLVALGAIELGELPGEGPPGEGIVLSAALVTMLAAASLAAFGPPVALGALLAPAAAGFLLARFYTFDPYYLPTLRRMSDDGLLSPLLVYSVLALAIGTAALSRVHARIGLRLSAVVVLIAAFFATVVAAGH